MIIKLPPAVAEFWAAHARLKGHYADSGLRFTLDGRLVGDIGEIVAAEAFDLQLCQDRVPGVDAHTRCAKRTPVQIKATGLAGAGPAFTPGEGVAEKLIFLRLDFENCEARVLYNGPERLVRSYLPPQGWTGTKRVSLARIQKALNTVKTEEVLPLVPR